MLALSKKCDYALIALAYLASPVGRVASATKIAQRFDLPVRVLMNVLKQLAQEGLVHSARGSRGGYSLTSDPRKITLGQLVRIIEGPIGLAKCLPKTDSAKKCSVHDQCPVRWPVARVQEKIESFLDEITIAHITAGMQELAYHGDDETTEITEHEVTDLS